MYGEAFRDSWIECKATDQFTPDSDAESISDDEYFAREREWEWADAGFDTVCAYLHISSDDLLLR